MAAETARQFEALEAQAQKIMGVFTRAGYEAVAPAMIQPAGVFLDVIGEELRARTYVFSDPDGAELCLRPDLTVPTCRLHIERHGNGAAAARYCYNGAAFRFQPQGGDAAHPREFRQAGIENFGAADREQAEAETVAIILQAHDVAGLAAPQLRLGDLGLVRALLSALDIPETWRKRLMHQFWRPAAFRAELKRLAKGGAHALARIPEPLRSGLDKLPRAEAERRVAAHLDSSGIDVIGNRTLGEITENLVALAIDANVPPLDAATAQLIEACVAVKAPAREAADRFAALTRSRNLDLGGALAAFERRLALMQNAGVDLARVQFAAEFGRNLAYYTGFVFEVTVASLGGASPVAGGGRYDGLMKAAGAREDVPAVGAAIHTERLLAAVNGGRS